MVCETHLTTYINLFLEAIISVSRGPICREPYRVSNSLANVESTTVTSLPDPIPLRATLYASYHRILRALRIRGDDLNVPLLIFGGVLKEGPDPLTRRLLRGRMIEEMVRSQATNKVLMATHLQ